MGKNSTFWCLLILVTAFIISVHSTRSFANQVKSDTADLRIRNKATNKNSYLKSGFHLAFPSIKTLVSPVSKVAATKAVDDKLLSNVQIFPNPVTDQINLKYTISRNAIVSIKVMDVLGNNVLTLLQQRMDPGEQKFSYNINKQLTSGFYFVRVVVGTESVIKRISIL